MTRATSKPAVPAKKRIYADAAAATPLSPAARRELLRLLDVYGNAGALHQEAVLAKKELEKARAAIAKAIAAHPDEIVFTSSGTEGNNLAIQGVIRPLIRRHASGAKLHAITSAIEHQSVLEPLHALAAEGLEVTELPVDAEGLISAKDLREAIRDNTVFVSIQLVNSEVGTIEPIREFAKEIRHARKSMIFQGDTLTQDTTLKESPLKILPLYFHTDASQAPYWTRIMVENLGIDLLTLDAQKVQGPKGVGALYIKRSVIDPAEGERHIESVMRGGVQEFNLRAGTPNVPMCGSFAVALEEAQDAKKMEKRLQHVASMRQYLWEQLRKAVPDAKLNGPRWDNRCANNLNISVPGLDGETAVIALSALGVAASTRSACNTADEDPSHVIRAIGSPRELAKTAIRFTLLPTATKSEMKQIATALKRACELYRHV